MATIRKRGDKWHAQVIRKGHRAQYKSFRRKVDAENWAREVESRMDRRLFVDFSVAERILLKDVLTKYQGQFTPNKRSYASENASIRRLLDSLGDISLALLSPEDIVEYAEDRLETVVSDTVRKELNTLSVILDTAMALWAIHLPANPVTTGKRILTLTKTLQPGNRRQRRVNRDEEKALLERSQGPLYEFAISRGMRRGELANQRPEHRQGRFLLIPETKTDEARTIPLTIRDREILDEYPSWSLSADAITKQFIRDCRSLGIQDLRFHDLRHEATSRLFEHGFSIPEVALITGHADWTSLRRYTHLGHDPDSPPRP